jgi:signal transduction histidine kinase
MMTWISTGLHKIFNKTVVSWNFLFMRKPSFWVIIVMFLLFTSIYYAHSGFFNFINPRWEWLWTLAVFEFKSNINGSLFYILFIYAAVVFGWRGILITWLFSFAILLPRIVNMTYDTQSFMVNIVFLLTPLLVVLILNLLRIWRDTVRKAARQREEEHKIYVAKIIKAQEDERKRISREIHDDTTQRLWILANNTQNLITDELRVLSPITASQLEIIKNEILQISSDAKKLSLALRPGILDDLGLIPAIRWQVEQLSNNNIEGRIAVEGVPRQLTQEFNMHLFRIVQEALNNTKRHSGANEVLVTLAFHPKTVKLTIWDNGKGFSLRNIKDISKENKLGIIGLQERVRLLDGVLKINSDHDRGTKVHIEFSDQPSHNGNKQTEVEKGISRYSSSDKGVQEI